MLPEDREFEHGRVRALETGGTRPIGELLELDTPVARTELYLRLLYSDASAESARSALASATLAGSTGEMLRRIDWDGLGVERRARRRNLFAQLIRRSPTLMGAI